MMTTRIVPGGREEYMSEQTRLESKSDGVCVSNAAGAMDWW